MLLLRFLVAAFCAGVTAQGVWSAVGSLVKPEGIPLLFLLTASPAGAMAFCSALLTTARGLSWRAAAALHLLLNPPLVVLAIGLLLLLFGVCLWIWGLGIALAGAAILMTAPELLEEGLRSLAICGLLAAGTRLVGRAAA